MSDYVLRAVKTRNDPMLRRLVRAAVQLADILDTPEASAHILTDDYTKAFMQRDEELREASLAYARGLDDHDRKRLAR